MQPDELKTLRRQAGMSQSALGEAIGMARETIGAMERGQAPIELRTALAIRYLSQPEGGGPRSLRALYNYATQIAKATVALEPVTDGDRQQLEKVLSEWIAAGGSNIGYGLLMALSLEIHLLVQYLERDGTVERAQMEAALFLSAWEAIAPPTA